MSATTLVTKEAPDFTADAVLPDNSFGQITLSSFKGKNVVLFFYPLDFTFVCPSEILAFNKKLDEFKKRNTEVIGVSVDSKFTHLAWKNTKLEDGGIGNIQYTLVSDLNKSIAREYGILFGEAVALRGLEALRMVDALQFVETHGDQVCPANWQEGDEAMKPTAEGVAGYLAKHAK